MSTWIRAWCLMGIRVVASIGVAWIGAGCARVPMGRLGLVSKPNMLFSDSAIFGSSSRLAAQSEPGAAFTGGAQAGGCASCK